ncbi:MAG: peptidylprolyl isomerase [Firmicutes bacterium]|nr:peptidylprolyl isomerase [Bacillota bacterium]
MQKIKKGLAALLAILALAAVLSACSSGVVATVNGEKITSGDLEQRVNEAKAQMEKQGMDFSGDKGKSFMDSLRQETLEQMITTRLLLQEAKKMGTLTPEQVKEAVKPVRDQFSGEEEYKKFLARVKFSEEEVAYILTLQDKVTQDVKPAGEEEARKFYDGNKDYFSKPEQLQVRHILFFVDPGDKNYPVKHSDAEAKSLAEAAIRDLNGGKDFAELAAEKSEDEGTRANGGLYTFSKDEAVKEFSDAAFALKPGEYTKEPVKTGYGYHVIKLEKRIPAEVEPYDSVKQQIIDQLNEQAKRDRFSAFMQEARDKAVIVNKLAEKQGNEGKK